MGLLLVVHTLHLLAVPILVLWVGLEKKVSKKNLDARIFFFFWQESHPECYSRCYQECNIVPCTCEYWKVFAQMTMLSSFTLHLLTIFLLEKNSIVQLKGIMMWIWFFFCSQFVPIKLSRGSQIVPIKLSRSSQVPNITTLLFHMLCPKVLPLFSPQIGGWAKGGRHSNPLKRNFYFGELPKFQFVLGDGPIKKWLITIQIIYI